MYTVFNSLNPSAPPYDPDLWNGGANYASLMKALDSIYTGMDIEKPARATPWTYVQCFDLVRQIDLGLIQRKKHHEAVIEETLNIPYEAAQVLHNALGPYIGNRLRKNCYAYARDEQSDFTPIEQSCTPGETGGKRFDWMRLKGSLMADCRLALIESCEADGLEYVGLEPQRKKGFYMIAFYMGVNPKDDSKDFHYVREDRDGQFSHKSGVNVANRIDQTGKPIHDPAEALFSAANRTYKFEGYFLAPEPLR